MLSLRVCVCMCMKYAHNIVSIPFERKKAIVLFVLFFLSRYTLRKFESTGKVNILLYVFVYRREPTYALNGLSGQPQN